MDYQNYLTATIRVPVKISQEGELIMLDNHAEISVEPLVHEPRETFDSIYEKLIEYVRQNPSYLTRILDEGLGEGLGEGLDERPIDDLGEGLGEEVVSSLHRFSYFKKSKKPLNTSFRNKGGKHNFTKKNYE
jgi:hypothetical protein